MTAPPLAQQLQDALDKGNYVLAGEVQAKLDAIAAQATINRGIRATQARLQELKGEVSAIGGGAPGVLVNSIQELIAHVQSLTPNDA
jgi:hypothetical protein